jgi:hypothetical protein
MKVIYTVRVVSGQVIREFYCFENRICISNGKKYYQVMRPCMDQPLVRQAIFECNYPDPFTRELLISIDSINGSEWYPKFAAREYKIFDMTEKEFDSINEGNQLQFVDVFSSSSVH